MGEIVNALIISMLYQCMKYGERRMAEYCKFVFVLTLITIQLFVYKDVTKYHYNMYLVLLYISLFGTIQEFVYSRLIKRVDDKEGLIKS